MGRIQDNPNLFLISLNIYSKSLRDGNFLVGEGERCLLVCKLCNERMNVWQ